MTARIVTVAALLMSLGLGQAAAQGQSDFSGSWKVNVEKSDPMGGMGGGGGAGGGGMMGSAITTITQTAAKLTIETKVGDQPPRVSNYNLDGTQSVNTTQRGESKSTAMWDGANLVISTESSFNGPNGAMTTTAKSVRSLSADGKLMTVTTTRTTPNGEMTTKQVYDKQ